MIKMLAERQISFKQQRRKVQGRLVQGISMA
jgi:hypothetical protein